MGGSLQSWGNASRVFGGRGTREAEVLARVLCDALAAKKKNTFTPNNRHSQKI